MCENEEIDKKKEKETNDSFAYLIMAAGFIGAIATFRSGAGASVFEVSIYIAGGLLLLGVGLIDKYGSK